MHALKNKDESSLTYLYIVVFIIFYLRMFAPSVFKFFQDIWNPLVWIYRKSLLFDILFKKPYLIMLEMPCCIYNFSVNKLCE